MAPSFAVTVGRQVHYVLKSGPSKGEPRPATIVRAWSHLLVNLVVAIDGTNDDPIAGRLHLWETSVAWSPDNSPGTWHWPPIVTA